MSQTTTVTELDAILAKAKEAAQAVVPAPAASTAVATAAPITGGRPVTMMEMLQEGGVSVDAYLKVDKPGFTVGTDTETYHKSLDVEFRLSDAKPYYGLRFGNPAKYLRSYDRITEARTRKPWAQCQQEAAVIDPRCKGDYRAVDIPFTTLQAVNAGNKEVEAGGRLGWSSSITNFKIFSDFVTPYYQRIAAGELSEDIVLRGKIVHKQQRADGNTWGLLTFEDFSVVVE